MQRPDGTASAVPFLFVIVLVALVRVAMTYGVLGQTFDEPPHIACGVEIATTGRYTLEPQHPPLARIAIGLTAHATLPDHGTVWERGNLVLYRDRDYVHNLAAARSGILIFLAIAIVVTWSWSRRLYGERVALLAALLVSTTPALLAHAGLATTDMAVAAMTLLALDRFSLWLSAMTTRNALLLGAACALALTAKFSALLFLPAGFAAILVARRRFPLERAVITAIVAALGAFLIVTWAVYAFSFNTPRQIAEGLRVAFAHERGGHPAYLLGRNSTNGFWYFFLVAFFVKTPLAMTALLLVGAARRKLDEPLAVVIAFFLVTMPIHVAIGLRHLLPIMPFVAMVGAAGAMHLALARAGRVIAALLLVWHLAATTLAHPDYLAYFNELVPAPDYVLVDSDLDWGQDILRLSEALDDRMQPLTVAYFGSADLRRHLPIPFRILRPGEQPFGWIAVSETILRKGKPPGRFAFLDGVPYRLIGESIRLYHR
jgi:hypothetical protein